MSNAIRDHGVGPNAHSAKISASYAIIEIKTHPLLAGLMDVLLLSINWGVREKTPPLGTRLMEIECRWGACLGFDSAS